MSLKQTHSPIVKPPATCLHTPPPPPTCTVVWAYQDPGRGLIMQAAVSLLRWGPPGDSSTASDWGCATEPDSSTNNTEKRMLMDQIRWVLRWEEGVQRRRRGCWQALLISCHSDEALCMWYLLCVFEREALAAQDYAPSYWHVFPPQRLEVWKMKEGCEQREGGAGKSDRWMDVWGYIQYIALFLSSSTSYAFPIFHLPSVTPPLSLTICLPQSHTLLQKRQHIKT